MKIYLLCAILFVSCVKTIDTTLDKQYIKQQEAKIDMDSWDCDVLKQELEAHGIHSVFDVLDQPVAEYHALKCNLN